MNDWLPPGLLISRAWPNPRVEERAAPMRAALTGVLRAGLEFAT